MEIITKKEFVIGVIAGLGALAILCRLPASFPGNTQIQSTIAKIWP
jgi:hypothetical protein